MKNIGIILAISLVCLLGAAFPAIASELLSISVQRQQEVITLSVPKTTPHKVFLVPNPDRLVIDVPAVPGKQKAALPAEYTGQLLKRARFGQFDPKTSRFVFDLNQAIRVVDVQRAKRKLVITIAASTAGAAPVVTEIPSFPTQPRNGAVAPVPGTVLKNGNDSSPNAPFAQRSHTLQKEKRETAKSSRGEKPMIVIDAGHGGVDPGTIGPNNSYEKNLTLAYAKMLKAKLLKTGRYRVKLTREDDVFIMLRKRVEIARRVGASMFISLHADSAPEPVARGLSVYTVSETASDKEAAALANRENKADVLAGVDLSDERNDVAGILISLAQRDTMNHSATLADELVTSLGDHIRLLQNSHRFAGFAVLKAPDIPSVLIEIGFLSNEEAMLNSKAYRDRVTSGIAAGVDAYFSEQKRMEN